MVADVGAFGRAVRPLICGAVSLRPSEPMEATVPEHYRVDIYFADNRSPLTTLVAARSKAEARRMAATAMQAVGGVHYEMEG